MKNGWLMKENAECITMTKNGHKFLKLFSEQQWD